MSALVVRGDAAHLPLPDASVDLVCTSPPYFALRSYQDGGEHYAGQIGSEATPAEWLEAMLACTAEWMRVLKPSGSIWVNLGDKYASQGGAQHQGGSGQMAGRGIVSARDEAKRRGIGEKALREDAGFIRSGDWGIPNKSLCGMPWRYALACIDQLGLILRAEVIWAKPNGLPESVTDRVRRSHEQWFHFTVRPRYYSAVDEIRERHTGGSHVGRKDKGMSGWGERILAAGEHGRRASNTCPSLFDPRGKLPGSVWTVPSEPLDVPAHLGVDHFAAFPTELPSRIVQGWSPRDVCTVCGDGLRPSVDRQRAVGMDVSSGIWSKEGRHSNITGRRYNEHSLHTITGYECACAAAVPTVPGIVVDPFGGTGTTALMADVLGRTGISIDMSHDYSRLARWRTSDSGQRARAMRVEKPPVQVDGQADLLTLLDGASV